MAPESRCVIPIVPVPTWKSIGTRLPKSVRAGKSLCSRPAGVHVGMNMNAFHHLTDPSTGITYITLQAVPDHVLTQGRARIIAACNNNLRIGDIDAALDVYNAWGKEIGRRGDTIP